MTIQVHRSIQSFRSIRRLIPNGQSVGFVPTMGALHEGHLSLVKKARAQNDIVVASIYVNPTQFGGNDDFSKYPRPLERDTSLLDDLGVDHVFAPHDMYGRNDVTFVDLTSFDHTSEGKARPGHFRGVATIVTKLFNIIQPSSAYFGQKDAAQCVLIHRIANDLNMDVSINVVETMRDPIDGLALSSRNVYLSVEERNAAPILYKSLCAAKTLHERELSDNDKPFDTNLLKNTVMNVLKSEPMVTEIQYVSVDSKENMSPLQEIGSDGAIVSIACKIGAVRLIDNIVLK